MSIQTKIFLLGFIIGVLFMARGHSDYGAFETDYFVIETPLSDVIAERQGFSRLDNRGRIIYFDDFRAGSMRWELGNNAPGVVPAYTIANPYSIGYHGSMLLDPVGDNGVSQLFTALVLPVSKKLGVEVGMRLLSNFGDIEIILGHNYDGTTSKLATFQIEGGTGKIQIRNNTTLTDIFTPSAVAQVLQSWISVKFVIDIENNSWERAMLGNQQFDLESYSLKNSVSSLQGYTELIIRNTGASVTLIEPVYIGYVVISGDEP
jgi:hypothetical protein